PARQEKHSAPLFPNQNAVIFPEKFRQRLFTQQRDRSSFGRGFIKLVMHQPLPDQRDVKMRILHSPDLTILQCFWRILAVSLHGLQTAKVTKYSISAAKILLRP